MTLEEFNNLASILERDTCLYSGCNEIINHPNFIKMKELNQEIIPYLIDKLKTDPHWWILLLLDEIVINKPIIPKEIYGVFKDIVQIWIDHLTNPLNEPLSPEALQGLYNGLKSVQESPPIDLGDFSKYIDD